MSTKIYNAYQVTGMTLDKLFLFLVELRKKYHDLCIKEIKGWYTSDEAIKYFKVQRILEVAIDSKENSNENFQASAVIYPYKGKLYVQFFGLSEDFLNNNLPDNFTDFHYQNQTDPPEGITYKAFEKRSKKWKAILGRGSSGIPSDNGLVFPIFERYHCFYVTYHGFAKEARGASR